MRGKTGGKDPMAAIQAMDRKGGRKTGRKKSRKARRSHGRG